MGFLFFYMVKYNSDRDEKSLIELRPNLILESFDSDGDLESFQNDSLRPILKFQHNVLLDFVLSQPNIDSVLKNRQIRRILESSLKDFINQTQLKGQLIGMTIGLFSMEELKFYNVYQKEINKRILQMILQRLVDSI
jgi:hypothetical protein